MVRLVLIGIFSFATTLGYSKSDKSLMAVAPFVVRSNTFNSDIPNGKFAVKGFVRNSSNYNSIVGAIVTNTSENPVAYSDSTGYFQMLFPLTDTVLFAYVLGMEEIVFNPKHSGNEFKNRCVMEIDFYLKDATYEVISFKPVVYVYNAAADFKLSIKPHGSFSFTYPKSNGDWELKTNSDGTLYDLKTKKNYPYIFWEGPGKDLDFVATNNAITGYLIKTDTCALFLENVLCKVGLNAKESADFITFWVPKMIQKEYALVQFLNSEMYTAKIATINVAPNPESMLRLYMYFMPLESAAIYFEINQPSFEKFERTGFTVIEWGGSILTNSNALSL